MLTKISSPHFIAIQLGCTEKSLTRAATATISISAEDFISGRITLETKRLLAHTDFSIGIIAEKLHSLQQILQA
ncbi:hypothetical protein [Pectinatus haikarae]|uniref:hypothetical protein n=1 Tax=Pectinatus haikarae TaxID=349096 RepID=UPI0018C6B7F2|nr:hypothetical protein [Pectinatus haikarae]